MSKIVIAIYQNNSLHLDEFNVPLKPGTLSNIPAIDAVKDYFRDTLFPKDTQRYSVDPEYRVRWEYDIAEFNKSMYYCKDEGAVKLYMLEEHRMTIDWIELSL